MDSFFDFIFGNLFFVIIVIAAIFNFFNKSKQAEQAEQKTGPRPTQSEAEQSRPRSLRERMEEALTNVENDWKQAEQTVKQEEQALPSIEEQRQAQYDRLKDHYQTAKQDANESMKQSKYVKEQETVSVGEKVSMSAHKKITQQSLVDGVIMAEILGPPRALKPYRNVVQERQR